MAGVPMDLNIHIKALKPRKSSRIYFVAVNGGLEDQTPHYGKRSSFRAVRYHPRLPRLNVCAITDKIKR